MGGGTDRGELGKVLAVVLQGFHFTGKPHLPIGPTAVVHAGNAHVVAAGKVLAGSGVGEDDRKHAIEHGTERRETKLLVQRPNDGAV